MVGTTKFELASSLHPTASSLQFEQLSQDLCIVGPVKAAPGATPAHESLLVKRLPQVRQLML